MKNILILGLGNDILTDDAIGPKLCWEMKNHFSNSEIHFETAAIGGFELLELIRDYKTVFIIDAIKTTNGTPGDVYYLTPESFKETLHISHIHDISFLTALELAKKLKIDIPEKIHIIAIEIIEDLTFGNDFSPPLQARYSEIKNEVHKMINELLREPLKT